MIEIYTDGSCHTQSCIGAWAVILFISEEKIVLSGTATDTTNNRMELTAVIKAIEYVKDKHTSTKTITVISDSQYVIGLVGRKEKFIASGFKTKKGNDIRNVDLVKQLLGLHKVIAVKYVKIKAHQKPIDEANYNIEADILARQIVRDAVNKSIIIQ